MSGSVGSNDLSPLLASRRRTTLTTLGLLSLVTVPFTTTAFVTELFFTGLVFVMLGVSWNLLAGYAGQISLGHAAFFGIGAFVSAWLTVPTRVGLPAAIEVHPFVALVAGTLAGALLALAVGPVMFRLTGHYFAIGTLALAAIIQLLLLDQRQFSGGSTGLIVATDVSEDAMFLVALAATVAMILVTSRIVNSSIGLGMRAVHGDEGAASSLGVNPLKYKMYAFVISSGMAGLTGAFYAQYIGYVNPESTLAVVWTIDTLVIVILGGMGTMLGPVLGAGLFLVLDEVMRGVAGSFATTAEGLLIILFIVFAPAGLYGFFESRFRGEDETQPETADGDRTSPE